MNNLIEYVKFRVRSKMELMSAAQPIIDKVMADIPVHIKAAVISMQRNKLIPSREVQFVLADVVNKHYNEHTEKELYSYLILPEDFQSIDYFAIYPQSEVLYKPAPNEHEAYRRYAQSGELSYLVRLNATFQDEKTKSIFILTPWPTAEDTVLVMNYWTDGREESLQYLDELYWEAVSDRVMVELNLVNEQKADRSMGEALAASRNKNGKASINEAPARLRVSFFGGRNFKI